MNPAFNYPSQQMQANNLRQQVQTTPFVWVSNQEAAINWPLNPGSSIVMMDASEPVIYIKTVDVKFTVAQEAAATRSAVQNDTQAILDKLCQLEMDGIKQNYENRIAAIQNALDAARSENQALKFQSSQGAQTSQILADNARQTVALEQYLNPTPVPAYVVQNPNCCVNSYSTCSCGA